jgi:DNA-binding GntR family transcriptional regulator
MAETAALAPIEHRTLNEAAYLCLKKSLLSGRFEPGTVLTLRGLAEDLGTSVMPVREAVVRLAAEQAFEVLPHRGIRIPELSAEHAEELWQLRIQLEGDSAGLAAVRIRPDELRELEGWRDIVRTEAESGQVYETLEANDSFQFAVHRAARTRALVRLIETLRMQCAPLMTGPIRTAIEERPPFFEETLGYHDQLVDALRRHDAIAAARVRRADLASLRDFVAAHERDRRASTGPAPSGAS